MSDMKHHLVDLYQKVRECDQEIPQSPTADQPTEPYAPGAKNGPPGNHMLYQGFYRENMKSLLSEAARPRALISCIWQISDSDLCLLSYFCQNYGPGAKLTTADVTREVASFQQMPIYTEINF